MRYICARICAGITSFGGGPKFRGLYGAGGYPSQSNKKPEMIISATSTTSARHMFYSNHRICSMRVYPLRIREKAGVPSRTSKTNTHICGAVLDDF